MLEAIIKVKKEAGKKVEDIEKRRQEELKQYEHDIVVSREIYEMTNDEGNTTYVEIRTMKDGSRRVVWGRDIKDTKNNKDVVTGNHDKISEGLSTEDYFKYSFDETTFGKPTKRRSDNNPVFKRENKINAKYDAELASLDHVPEAGEEVDLKITPYNENPVRTFNLIIDQIVDGNVIDDTSSYPIDEFLIDRDPVKLLNALEAGAKLNISGITSEEMMSILMSHINALSVSNTKALYESEFDIKEQISKEKDASRDIDLYPSEQQLLSLREIVSWFKSKLFYNYDTGKTERSAFREMVYLRGLAGTGKTNLMTKLIAKIIGISNDDIMAVGTNAFSTETINSSLGLEGKNTLAGLTIDSIPDNVKLLIVDEIGSASMEEINLLRDIARDINHKRLAENKEGLRIILSGDPSQITAGGAKAAPINGNSNPAMGLMKDITPLTIPFRSDNSSINQLASLFHMNKRAINEISLGHNGTIGNEINGTYVFSSKADLDNHLNSTKSSPNSKVIVVATESEKIKYANSKMNVLTYREAQGMTIDEIYIDLQRDSFDTDAEYNTAMYTMTTRGVKLVGVLDYSNKFSNAKLDSTAEESSSNMAKYKKDSKSAFLNKRKEELSILSGVSEPKAKEVAKDDKEKSTGKETVNVAKESPDDKATVQEAFGLSDEKASVANKLIGIVNKWVSKRAGKNLNILFKKVKVEDIDVNNPKLKKQFIKVNKVGNQYEIKIADDKVVEVGIDETKYNKAIDMFNRGFRNNKIFAKTGYIVNPNGQAYLYSPFIDYSNPFKNIEWINDRIEQGNTVRIALPKVMNLLDNGFSKIVDMAKLQNTTVKFEYSMKNRFPASFEYIEGERNGVIVINTRLLRTPEEIATSIVHETQHAIQLFNKELTKAQIKNNDDIIASIVRSVDEFKNLSYSEAVKKGYDLKFTEKKLTVEHENLIQQIIYQINADEVEARMAQNIFDHGEILDDYDTNKVVFQSNNGEYFGAMTMNKEEMEAMIYAFEKGDIHTVSHELAHIVEDFLSTEEKNTILKWAEQDTWNTEASEMFAKGFEQYLAEGKSPVKELDSLFSQMKQWLKDIYESIANISGLALTDDVRALYDSIISDEYIKDDKPIVEEVVSTDDIVDPEELTTDYDGSNDFTDPKPIEKQKINDKYENTTNTSSEEEVKEPLPDSVNITYPTNRAMDDYKEGDEVVFLKMKQTEGKNDGGIGVYVRSKRKNDTKYTRIGLMSLEEARIAFGDAVDGDNISEFANEKYFSISNLVGVDDNEIISKGNVDTASKVGYKYDKNSTGRTISDVIRMFEKFITANGFNDFFISNVEFKVFKGKDIQKVSNGDKFRQGAPYVFLTASNGDGKKFTHHVMLEQKRLDSTDENYIKPIAEFSANLSKIEDAKVFGRSGGYKYSPDYSGERIDENNGKLKIITNYIANNFFSQNKPDGFESVITRNEFTQEDLQGIKDALSASNISSEGITLEILEQFSKELISITDGTHGYSNENVKFNDAKFFDSAMVSLGFEDVTDTEFSKKQFLEDGKVVKAYYSKLEGEFYVYTEGNASAVKKYTEGFESNPKYKPSNYKKIVMTTKAGKIQNKLNSLASANNEVNGKSMRARTTNSDGTKIYAGRPILSPIDVSRKMSDKGNRNMIAVFKEINENTASKNYNIKDSKSNVDENGKVINNNARRENYILLANEFLNDGIITQEEYNTFINNEVGRNEGNALLKEIINSNEVRQPIDSSKFDSNTDYSQGDDINVEKQNTLASTNLESINNTSLTIKNLSNTEAVEETTEVNEENKEVTEEKFIEDKYDDIGEAEEEADLRFAEKDETGDKFSKGVHESELGERVTVAQAKKAIKKLIPNISDNDIVILERSVAAAYINRGSYGFYSDGVVYLIKNEDGTVYKNIARHEAFHSMFLTMFSNKEQAGIIEALKADEPTLDITDNEHLEEILARKFQVWRKGKQTFSDKLIDIFKKILRFLSFNSLYKKTLDDYFTSMEAGKYNGYVREFSGNRFAKSAIHLFNSESSSNLDKYNRFIAASDYVERVFLAVSNIKGYDILSRYEIASKAKALIERNLELDRLDVNKIEADIKEKGYSDILVAKLAQAKEKLNVTNDADKRFVILLKSMYPSLDLSRMKDILFDSDSAYDEFSDMLNYGLIDNDLNTKDNTDSEEDYEVYTGNGISDYTIENNTVDREAQMSSSIKDFISSIRYNGKTLSPKEGFFNLIEILNLYKPQSKGNFTSQINLNKDRLGSDNKIDAIIESLDGLLSTASINTYKDPDGNVKNLGEHFKMIDSDMILVSKDNEIIDESKPDSYIAISRLKDGKFLSTKAFIIEAIRTARDSNTNITNENLDYFGLGSKAINLEVLSYKAANTFNEMMSLINSLKKDNMSYIDIDMNYGVYKLSHNSSKGLDSVKNYKGYVASKLDNIISSKNLAKTRVAVNKIVGDKTKSNKDKFVEILDTLNILVDKDNIPEDGLEDAVDNLTKLFTIQDILKKAEIAAKNNKDDVDEVSTEEILKEANAILNSVSGIIAKSFSLDQQPFIKSKDGSKRYLWNASDWGYNIFDTFKKISDGYKGMSIPAHLKGKFFNNNIYVDSKNSKAISRIHDIDTHEVINDGLYRNEYKEEKAGDYYTRVFSGWFLSDLTKNSSVKTVGDKTIKAGRYTQRVHIISNKPKALGAKVDFLYPKQIKEGYKSVLQQHIDKTNGNRMVNNSLLFKAVDYIIKSENLDYEVSKVKDGVYDMKLDNDFVNRHGDDVVNYLYNTLIKEEALLVADRMIKAGVKLDSETFKNENLLDKIIDKSVYKNFDKTTIFKTNKVNKDTGILEINALKKNVKDEEGNNVVVDDVSTSFKLRESLAEAKERGSSVQAYIITKEELAPYVHSFIANDSLQADQLTQIVAGDSSYFGDPDKMTKRMSGVFAPGLAPHVHKIFGSKEEFRAVVAKGLYRKVFNEGNTDVNPEGYQTLEDVFSAIGIDQKGIDDLKSIYANDDDFEYTDAQGFMLPERLADLKNGIGEAYALGNSHKPVYYGIDGETGEATMFKYSSFVLTDYVVSQFPELGKIRDKMRNAEGGAIGELLFDSGVKVGTKNTASIDANDLFKDDYTISNDNAHTLRNENYRLQFNPVHKSPASVAHPSQLSYFINVMKHDMVKAKQVYNAIRLLTQHALDNVQESFDSNDSNKVFKSSLELLEGEGNEFEYELMEGLHDEEIRTSPQNMPNIIKKFYTGFASHITNNVLKIKYDGGKFTLVADLAVNNPTTGKPLQVKKDDNGNSYYAECLLNRGFALKTLGKKRVEEIEKAIKNKEGLPDLFLGPDLMSFRIPSSELHSAMPLKVVGFTENNSFNSIIAPDKIVPLHGSDYDVDALYVISRATGKDGKPVGYRQENGKHVFKHIELDNKTTVSDYHAAIKAEFGDDVDVTKYIKNSVIQGFLDIVTDPNNRFRMVKPISMGFIHNVIKDINVFMTNKAIEKDLSSISYSQETHASSFDGLSGTGILANAIKAMVFLSNASDTNGPATINFPKNNNEKLMGNGKDQPSDVNITYNGNEVTGLVNNEKLWETLDGFLNAAIDNVKEQILPYFNLTQKTIKNFVAMVGTGMKWEDAGLFMKQPIIKKYSQLRGNAYDSTAGILKFLLDIKSSDSLMIESTGHEDITSEMLKNSIKNYLDIDDLLTKKFNGEELLPKEIEYVKTQVTILQVFSKYSTIGAGISSVSGYLKILSEQKVTESDFAIIDEKRNAVFSKDFVFNLPKIFDNNPHLEVYDNSFEFFNRKKNDLMLRYAPKIAKNVAKSFSTINSFFKVNNDRNKEEESRLDLFMKIFGTSINGYNNINKYPQFKVGDKTYKGKDAFTKRVHAVVEELRSNDNLEMSDRLRDFTNRLVVSYNRTKGRNDVSFYSDSSMVFKDKKKLQLAMDELSAFSFKDSPSSPNGVIITKGEGGVISNIQDLLVYNAIIENGLSFGSNNYSMYISAPLIESYYTFYENNLKDMANSGIGLYNDYITALSAISSLGNDKKDTFNYKKATEAGVHTSKNGDKVYYDISITDSDSNSGANNFISSSFDGYIGDRKARFKKVYAKVLNEDGVNYYSLISQSSALSPVVNIDKDALNDKYFYKYNTRPDLKNTMVKDFGYKVEVKNKGYEVGELVNVSEYRDYGKANPLVFKVDSVGKETTSLSLYNNGNSRSESITLLTSMGKNIRDMAASLYKDSIINGDVALLTKQIKTEIIDPKFSIDGFEEARKIAERLIGLTVKSEGSKITKEEFKAIKKMSDEQIMSEMAKCK